MTKGQMAHGGGNTLGMAVASLLLVAAWWASADTCVGLRCVPVPAFAATVSDKLLIAPDATSGGASRVSQTASLLLLGSGFALTAQILKRQKSS